jgi:hypothetical protein
MASREQAAATLRFAESFHIYVRREGTHFVALCAELGAIIEGASVNEIVNKSKRIIASKRSPGTAESARLRIVLRG